MSRVGCLVAVIRRRRQTPPLGTRSLFDQQERNPVRRGLGRTASPARDIRPGFVLKTKLYA
jgi:hypothetical protein